MSGKTVSSLLFIASILLVVGAGVTLVRVFESDGQRSGIPYLVPVCALEYDHTSVSWRAGLGDARIRESNGSIINTMEDCTIHPSMKSVWAAYLLAIVIALAAMWAINQYAQDPPTWLYLVPLIVLLPPLWNMHLRRRTDHAGIPG